MSDLGWGASRHLRVRPFYLVGESIGFGEDRTHEFKSCLGVEKEKGTNRIVKIMDPLQTVSSKVMDTKLRLVRRLRMRDKPLCD